MLFFFKGLGMDVLVSKTVGITYNDDLIMYNSPEDSLFCKSPGADAHVMNDLQPDLLLTNSFFKHNTTLIDDPRVHHLEQDIKKTPTVAKFLGKEPQQTSNIFHSIVTLFMMTMYLFE